MQQDTDPATQQDSEPAMQQDTVPPCSRTPSRHAAGHRPAMQQDGGPLCSKMISKGSLWQSTVDLRLQVC